MRKPNQPAWWQVNGIVIGAVILLWWEARAGLATPLRQIVLVGIIFLVHGLIAWWVQANQVGLEREHLERQVRAQTRQIVAELERKERAQARARRASASEAQAGRPTPGKDGVQGLSPTPVQEHFRQVMTTGKS